MWRWFPPRPEASKLFYRMRFVLDSPPRYLVRKLLVDFGRAGGAVRKRKAPGRHGDGTTEKTRKNNTAM